MVEVTMIQGRFRRAWQENKNVPPPAAAAFGVRRGAAVPLQHPIMMKIKL